MSSSSSHFPKPINSSASFFTIPFKSTTSRNDWILFLNHMQDITKAERNIHILDRLICYKDTEARVHWLKLFNISNYVDPNIVTAIEAIPILRASGTLMIFTGPNRKEMSTKTVPHCFAAFWRNGIWGVYDSSFCNYSEVEEDITNLMSFRYLLEGMRERNIHVEELWVGGGGNTEGTCVEMTRAWVEEEVVKKDGAELGNWAGREGWKKIRRS